MFSFLLLFEIIPFNERKDNILKNNQKDMKVYASGSIGQWIDDKCVMTHPEDAVDSKTRKTDWCSNINKTKTDRPWLEVSLNGKTMKIKGYSLRAGCCEYPCCCDENGVAYNCCCDLYSWSLQGSNDNTTWKTLHKVEQDKEFYGCRNRTYDIETTDAFAYIRLIQDLPWPTCNYCICINKMELYGSTEAYGGSYDDNEESVSIIGKVKRSD